MSGNRHIVCMVIMISLFFVYVFRTYNQYLMEKLNNWKNQENNKRGSIINKNERQACGVILHAHINKCAGGTIMEWFRKHTRTLMIGSIHHQQAKKNRMNFHKNSMTIFEPEWTKMVQQVDSFLADLSPIPSPNTNGNVWKVLEVHMLTPGLMLMKEYIEEWEKRVKDKGCIFYKTTILRDPLDRFVSNVNWANAPLSNIDSFMESRRNWMIRFLLFGLCGYKDTYLKCEFQHNGNHTITPNLNENLIKEIHSIVNNLDFVGFTDNLDGYYEKIRQITGWKSKNDKVDRVHKSKSTFNLTRGLISKFIDLNQYDYMFYYSMRNKYTQHF